MKTFRVSLVRSYVVFIKSEDEESAREYNEFYLGDCPDLSTAEDRKKNNFSIIESEMTFNEAIEAEKLIYD